MTPNKPKVSLDASLTAVECARYLAVSKRTILDYIIRKRLKAHRVRNAYRIFGRDLIQLWISLT
jgi:excisionase family DNA binding protein